MGCIILDELEAYIKESGDGSKIDVGTVGGPSLVAQK